MFTLQVMRLINVSFGYVQVNIVELCQYERVFQTVRSSDIGGLGYIRTTLSLDMAPVLFGPVLYGNVSTISKREPLSTDWDIV